MPDQVSFDELVFNMEPNISGLLSSAPGGNEQYTSDLIPLGNHHNCIPHENVSNTIGAFYAYFHPTHPFLLPRSHLSSILKESEASQLELAMLYLGSCYICPAQANLISELLQKSILHQSSGKSGYQVQAMLLFAMGLHAHEKQEYARQVLQTAIELALEIGMHCQSWILSNPDTSELAQESWRRTWWELYVVDGMMASTTQQPCFLSRDVASDVPLPCEETEYAAMVCAQYGQSRNTIDKGSISRPLGLSPILTISPS